MFLSDEEVGGEPEKAKISDDKGGPCYSSVVGSPTRAPGDLARPARPSGHEELDDEGEGHRGEREENEDGEDEVGEDELGLGE